MRWMRMAQQLAIPVAVGLLLAGCPWEWRYDDCKAAGTCQCRGPGDCANGQVCINGQCGYMPDASVELLAFGQVCTSDEQCASGFCIPAAAGTYHVCTARCEGDCPAGWDCKVRPGEPPLNLCVEHADRLCLGCTVDAHCHPAFGDSCIEVGTAHVCGMDCRWESCPAGYTCQTVDTATGSSKQCVPATNSCDCTPDNVGLTRGCTSTSAVGTCFGETTCQDNGAWTRCTAAAPQPEVCNGQDDDCDGLVDDDDPSVDISALPGQPPYPRCQKGPASTCTGRWTCRQDDSASYDWFCDAVDPVAEICDGLDNDCDEGIDEDFRDASGTYVHPRSCGSCGYDCTTLIGHLERGADGEVLTDAVDCVLRSGAPSCIPRRCELGYAAYPERDPLTCLHLVSPQCRPCTGAADCLLSSDRCSQVGVDPHASCLQGCGPGAPYGACTGIVGQRGCCPEGHLCDRRGSALVCVPQSESCDCDLENVGMVRSCFVTGGAGARCVGQQTCQADAAGNTAFDVCDASTTSMEVCDGVDNDCNGVIDDPFFDHQGSGAYDVDEHCGDCSTNCRARWNNEIQHAVGGCVLGSPRNVPQCQIVACTQHELGAGAGCRLDAECPAGWNCDPQFFVCRKRCSAPADCSDGASCVDGECLHPCTGDTSCQQRAGANSVCRDSFCRSDFLYHDVDTVSSNGCECVAPLTDDRDEPDVYTTYPQPGVPYVDRNCDGVDGDAAHALFVWADSTDRRGTREAPYQTVAEALAAFDPARHTQILVAAGYYPESFSLATGVRLYGGYAPGFAARDVALFPTIIAGPEPDYAQANHLRGVVNAVDVQSGQAVLAGFVIYGFDATYRAAAGAAGASSYAIYLRDCSDALQIVDNVIIGGRGGDGGHGSAGSPGNSGDDGRPGNDSRECGSATCSNESQPGGAAGGNGVCSGASGQPGAASSGDRDPQDYQNTTGGNGTGGSNAVYSSSLNPDWINLCKYDCVVPENMTGGDAQSGHDGVIGGGGGGCVDNAGLVTDSQWQPANSGTGSTGSHGSGGGGGGAGGSVTNENPMMCSVGHRVGDLGATGGGGGGGGCAGGAGEPGGGGGGSFAVFIVNADPAQAAPVLHGNVVVRGPSGSAGNGGAGGHGGLGGEGGEGGVSANPAWCAGFGGKGGRGGNGGAGGGGGGGCGGVSYGVAGHWSGGLSYATSNEFPADAAPQSGAPGGAGGPSPTGGSASGSTGAAGAWGDVHAY